MDSRDGTRCRVGCPIRRSPDRSLLAAPRGFSQRATSFVASRRQGIHQMPFSRSPRPGGSTTGTARRIPMPKGARPRPKARPAPASQPGLRGTKGVRKGRLARRHHTMGKGPAPPTRRRAGPPAREGRGAPKLADRRPPPRGRMVPSLRDGGPGPTRTADLTLIRRAL